MTRWRSYVPSALDNLIWFILIGVVIFFATQTDKFLTPINLRNILVAASVLGILVVGQSFVLITGNFDLSSESTLGLAALIGLFLIVPPGSPTWGSGTEIPPLVSIAIILAMGAGIGWVIGALITYGKMNNFIVTLAMLIILRGAMLRFTNGQAVSSIDSRPAEIFNWLGHESAFSLPWLGKVPISVLVMLAVFFVAYVVLKYRPFGRELYAIGGNRSAALASGIDPDKRVRQVYMISGFLAAIAGWMLAGRISSVQSDLGEGYIFNVMAAAVIGGISLLGGRGSIVGALGGVLLLSIIDRGLNLMQVSVFWIQSIQGFVILLAMFIDAQKVRFRGPALSIPSAATLGVPEDGRDETAAAAAPSEVPRQRPGLLAGIRRDHASRGLSKEDDMSEGRPGPVAFPAAVSRYGRDERLPPRHDLRAGPVTAVLEGGDLRYVRLGADTVVLRLYAAIRDRNWDTIEPRYLSYELDRDDDRFSVRFFAENVGNDVDFEWQGSITGTADGVITATMDGVARKNFLRNRIGWCVLHPMELAGVRATVETPEATVEGPFPDLISPHQPFVDMQSIAHATRDGEIVIRFEGDLWEMEDQRNWTDASYKTYSTPLRLPYPVEIHAGDRVWQRVTIEARGGAKAIPAAGGPVRVAVDLSRGRTIPPIGLGVASHGAPLAEEDVALLRALQPAHLHLTLDLTESRWRESLARATQEANALDAALAIEVIAGANGAALKDFAAALSGSQVDVARVLVFAHGEMVTDETVLTAARETFAAAGVETLVGGGSRAFFTELNRATLPLAAMDVVSYTLNPQVHAFDNASITETLAAQPETVRSARAIVGDRPLVVGPITLRPRFNPNAIGPEPRPGPGELPSSVDYRQPSLFAAGWLAGSINALGNAGVDGLTYFETTGWKGLIERRDHPLRVAGFHSWPGMVFPVYHVLADVAAFRGGQIVPITLGDGLRVQAVALRDGDRVRVILANMGDESLSVSLEIPEIDTATARSLDDETVYLAATDPDVFRASAKPIDVMDGTVTVDLPPFGLATVDGKTADA